MLSCVPDEPTMSMHDIACVLRDHGHHDAHLNILRYIELADILADQHAALLRAAAPLVAERILQDACPTYRRA